MTIDASAVGFLQVQAGKQATFGTDVAPDFKLPVVGVYQDAQQEHVALWDPGVWTRLTIVDVVGRFARFTLNGVLFYELLPVLFNAGFDEMEPSGSGPYSYTGSTAPGAAGSPAAYTFRFGGNDSAGGAASAVEIRDAHMQTLTLTHNMNTKAVLFTAEWFGAFVDDNGGAGYELDALALVDNPAMLLGLTSTLEIQDAGTTGGDFATMTAFDCSLIDWQLTIDTGLRPAWSGDKNQLTYCGPRVEEPSCTFAPVLRTSGANYAVTKVKAELRTYQELQLTFTGENSRHAIFQMTGRWLPNFEAHDRNRNEVVMQPVFRCETPHTQTTTPHWLSWDFDTQWEHDGGGITIDFLFRDDYTTPESAPIADPRTAEPGPGTSTFIDGGGEVITGGALDTENFTYLNVVGALTRQGGQGVFMDVTFDPTEVGVGTDIGFDYAALDSYFRIGNATPRLTCRDYSLTYDPSSTTGRFSPAVLTGGDRLQVGIIRRQQSVTSRGNYYVVKGEGFTEWTLFYAGDTDTIVGTQYAFIESGLGGDLIHTWRVANLDAPFSTDNGLAAEKYDGVVSVSQAFTHPADFSLEFDITGQPTTDPIQVDFRMSGSSGFRIEFSPVDDLLRLYRLDAGTPTLLDTSAATIANQRVWITCVDDEIVVNKPGTRMVETVDANYKTQTGGIYTSNGTDGEIQDLIVWPWTLSGTAAAILDAVFA